MLAETIVVSPRGAGRAASALSAAACQRSCAKDRCRQKGQEKHRREKIQKRNSFVPAASKARMSWRPPVQNQHAMVALRIVPAKAVHLLTRLVAAGVPDKRTADRNVRRQRNGHKPTDTHSMSKFPDVKKVVLAYSGGLDTSIILKWLQTELGAEVVTFTADLGQGADDLEPARRKAEQYGRQPDLH